MKQPLVHRTLTKEEFLGLLKEAFAIDARLGGYVVGRSHEEGGIKCFIETEEGFELIAEIEGGEYIINGGGASQFEKELASLNAMYASEPASAESLAISEYSTVYNTRGSQEKLLWVSGGGFIMNKYATRQYFQIIEKINFSSNPLRLYDT
ncbi:hypothetical protein Q0590_29275 [Rhodocytophaga aerolata]|uniref:Uncharacterized protein n=1 Tax=Rhodocytophaga aerolata TaxID=455078 RepID=A0ABT8RGX6_9BACT|nr:hypothetical protein [Rhodocytophaga aerolata]MDO1450403.1 hypothetical protein [Rhodocytophaga aerolata]